jgi:outer membrane protein OmpA-like peptidoglycan-associated protein
MKLRPIAIAVGVVLAGCATQHAPPPRPAPAPAAIVAAPAPVAAPEPVFDYRYRLLTAEATGTEQVFDDGKRTYVRFQSAPPPGVLFFEQDGQPLRAKLLDRFAVIDGIHAGVLIRSTTNYSYAAPIDALRVAGVRAKRANGSPAAADADLPPELAAQRAIILETEARLQGVSARIPNSKTMADVKAVNRELDEIQTVIDGMAASMVRLYFATGRSNISLSPGAREILRLAARSAKTISVRGRTDNVGSQLVNLQIARARTKAAHALLRGFGVPVDRIQLDPVAMNDYLADNTTEQGRARNRRVELVFVPAGDPVAAQ